MNINLTMAVVELKVPAIGESVTEVTLSKWIKPNGSFVKLDEAICEFESDKATLEFPSEAEGILVHVAKEGEDLPIGALVAKIDTSSKGGPDLSGSGKEKLEKQPPAKKEAEVKVSSPAAAKILREAELEPSEVKGTGREGRIMKQDAIEARSAQKRTDIPVEPVLEPNLPIHPAAPRQIRRVKLSRMRRTIARRLVSAKNETAMLTTFNELDMSALMKWRSAYNEAFLKKHGVKLGFMSFFAKACAKVLMEMPEVNAHLDGEDLIFHDFVDISIAISTPNGLVVPPIRDIESISIADFEKQLKLLAEKARSNSLSMEEMSGGTFTITNGGVFGSLMSTPILNEPQSAILGMHAIKERPVVVDGQIQIRPMMYLALSYDHRVIDGSSSVVFLVKIKELLEDPARLFLDV